MRCFLTCHCYGYSLVKVYVIPLIYIFIEKKVKNKKVNLMVALEKNN